VKSTLSRLPVFLPAVSAVIAASSGGPKQYVPFVKSVYAGAAYLIRKVFSANFLSILSRFYGSISDESVFAMIAAHFEVVRVLNHCGARALTKHFPNYPNKYVTGYLAKSLDKKSRRDTLKFHHQYLAEHLGGSFYEQILRRRPVLWSETIEGDCYAVSLSFNPRWHSEGDISITFDKNETPLYELAFSIVPGALFGCATGAAIFVGRVQGRKGQADEIRDAMRTCHRIKTPYLLMIAVQSIANALSITTVCGVRTEEQLAKTPQDDDFFFDYDTFWETFQDNKKRSSVYEISVPFGEKPLEQLKTKYRNRARLKRRLKNEIAASIGAAFASKFATRPQR
jgi:uncharacterized protein VirK/YbjX